MITTIAIALFLSISPPPETPLEMPIEAPLEEATTSFPELLLPELALADFASDEQQEIEPTEEIPALIETPIEDKAHLSDTQAYHEMMAHVPLMAHENPKSILIIGGTNGMSLAEALKHRSVQTAVLVNTNPLPCDDPRATLVTDDPARYVKKCNQTFDIILCDTEQELFASEFYEDCKDLLNKRGILVNYSGKLSFNQDTLQTISANRSAHFKHNTYYLVSTSRGQVAIGWSSDKKYRISESLLGERVAKIKEPMLYYTPEIHKASFALPNFIYSHTK